MAQDTWRNWAGTETANPLRFATPRSVEELSALVCGAAEHAQRVKAVGSGHSFTGVAVTDGILVSLDALTGIESVTLDEPAGALVTVLAGTRLHDLSEQLWHRGLAMINLGDIDVQSIAGALATGTHGTGARFGGLATQVRALQVVLADGAVADCSPPRTPNCSRRHGWDSAPWASSRRSRSSACRTTWCTPSRSLSHWTPPSTGSTTIAPRSTTSSSTGFPTPAAC